VRAAGLGFEPRLTDPESDPLKDRGRQGGTRGDKTALLSGIRYSGRDKKGQGETRGCGSVVVGKGFSEYGKLSGVIAGRHTY
jgi:hypothetical protein